MNCCYCNKKLNTTRSVREHERAKPPKYCLKVRATNKCEHCDYIFKYGENKDDHLNKNHGVILRQICYTRIANEFEEKHKNLLIEHNKLLDIRKKEMNSLTISLRSEYEPQLTDLELQLSVKNETIRVLEEQLQFERERTSSQFKLISEQKGNINITNNNTINCFDGVEGFLNLTPEFIKTQVDANFTMKHLLGGEKGVALFCKDNLLTNDEKNLLYVACDVARKKFKMKTVEGVKDDYKAYNLINSIHPPIMNKIHTDFCHPDKMDYIGEDEQTRRYDKMAECRKITKDSGKFCNYLSELTTT